MFDERVVEQVDAAMAALAGLDLCVLSTGQVERLVRATQAWGETLQGAHARVADEFERRGGPQLAGCSTMGAWLRRELRLSAAQARRRRRAGAGLRALPLVADALTAGSIRMEDVDVFADATRRIGTPVVRDAQQLLLGVAADGDIRDLRIAVDRLRDAIDPDAADRAWAHAQEKQDLTCHRVGTGYQVHGWLSPETGAKLRTLLDAFGKPAHAEDDRPVARRRVEGLDALLDAVLAAVLAGGLPTDHGVGPHLVVTVDVATLAHAMGGDRVTPSPPATLAGYGTIGRDLLTRVACDAAVTVVLTDGETTEHRSPPTGRAGEDRSGGGGGGDPGPTSGHDPPGARHACGCRLTRTGTCSTSAATNASPPPSSVWQCWWPRTSAVPPRAVTTGPCRSTTSCPGRPADRPRHGQPRRPVHAVSHPAAPRPPRLHRRRTWRRHLPHRRPHTNPRHPPTHGQPIRTRTRHSPARTPPHPAQRPPRRRLTAQVGSVGCSLRSRSI